jgi:hypothetical protein
MSYEYVNKTYKTNFKAGQRIKVDGKPGRILGARGNPSHLHVRLDGQKRTAYCHPTWEIELEEVKND